MGPTPLYTATKNPFMYSFSGNCAASAPISTFMCLWAIYIFPRLVHVFPAAEQADRSWEYINRPQKHMNVEIGLWPRSCFPGNTGFEFSVLCLCSVVSLVSTAVSAFRAFVSCNLWEGMGTGRNIRKKWSKTTKRTLAEVLLLVVHSADL